MVILHNSPWIIQGLVLGMIPGQEETLFTRKSAREKPFVTKTDRAIPL
jgi:hypothetical protein